MIDNDARGLAGAALGAANPVALRSVGNVGMRLLEGRVFNASANTSLEVTDELLIRVAASNIIAVRVVFCAGQTGGGTAATPTMNAAIRAVPDTTDASAQAALHKTVTVGGSTTWAFTPSASSSRRNYILSDWIATPPVPRTDGGTGSLFVVRSHRTAGQVVISGNGTQSFTNWASHPTAPFRMRSIAYNADYANGALWASWSAGSAFNGSSIAGIQYMSANGVVNIIGFGDSITEGQGTYIGEGWGLPAAISLTQNDGHGIAYEWSNMGWSGSSTPQILQNILDANTQGVLPTGTNIIALPVGSPNDVGNNTITTNMIYGGAGNPTSNMHNSFVKAMVALKGLSNPPIVIPWTWIPTNSAVNNYGSSDALREAYNTVMRNMGINGMIVADFATALNGVVTNGQRQMLAGSTTDGIHPNDTGNAILSQIFSNSVRAVFKTVQGQLFSA